MKTDLIEDILDELDGRVWVAVHVVVKHNGVCVERVSEKMNTAEIRSFWKTNWYKWDWIAHHKNQLNSVGPTILGEGHG